MVTYLAIILGLLPGLAWLFFFLQEDLRPEPKRLIALTFIAGALSVSVALLFEEIFNNSLKAANVAEYSLLSVLGLALIEELAKFFAAYLTVGKKSAMDEPVDAMIYIMVAALGFATVENVAALFGGGSGSPLAAVNNILIIASFRFAGTTLIHSLASGVAGYYWALSIREFGLKKPLIQGIALAALLHAAFNLLIIYYGGLVYGIVFVAILGFFVLNDFDKLKKKSI